jgi:hypothetical protein
MATDFFLTAHYRPAAPHYAPFADCEHLEHELILYSVSCIRRFVSNKANVQFRRSLNAFCHQCSTAFARLDKAPAQFVCTVREGLYRDCDCPL